MRTNWPFTIQYVEIDPGRTMGIGGGITKGTEADPVTINPSPGAGFQSSKVEENTRGPGGVLREGDAALYTSQNAADAGPLKVKSKIIVFMDAAGAEKEEFLIASYERQYSRIAHRMGTTPRRKYLLERV